MKKFYFFLMAMAIQASYAQNVGIGTTNPQNKLHVAGGLRVDSLANNKDSGIILHNKAGDVYSLSLTGKSSDVLTGNGTFANAALATGSWNLNGNAGTDSNTNFIGTTDNQPLRFRVNNVKWGSFGKNLSLGNEAILNNQSVDNIAIGGGAMRNVLHSNSNMAIGYGAMASYTGDNRQYYPSGENLVIGYQALYSCGDCDNVTAIGYQAMYRETSAGDNTAVGHMALWNNQGAVHNTGIGFLAMRSNSSGGASTAVGYGALANSITGGENTAVGSEALGTSDGGNGQTAIGSRALLFNLGTQNTATGASAMQNNQGGSYNAAYGFQTLMNSTSSSYNSAYGFKAMFTNTTGAYNTATGFKALNFNTTGSNNTATGWQALNTNITGSYNTAVGTSADVTAGNFTNATAIGYNAKVNASNKVRIGNASVTKIEGQVPFTTPSDGRFKFNVREDVKGLDFILKLRPVTYQFDVSKFDGVSNNDKNSATWASYNTAQLIRRTGFIAQEVEKAAMDSRYDFSGIDKPVSSDDHYSLSYESFVVPLVKGMQEQQAIILAQQKTIDNLLVRIEALEKNAH